MSIIVRVTIAALLLFGGLFAEGSLAKEQTLRVELEQDTTVHNSFPYTSYAGRHYLALGYESKYAYFKSRVYVKYGLDPLIAAEIEPDQIISANLKFMQHQSLGNNATYLVQVIEPATIWDHKSITWSNQPAYTVVGEPISQPKHNGWKSYNVTDSVKKQLLSQDWSRGIGLRFKDEDLRGVHYWSKECILITDINSCSLYEVPYLEIVYDDLSLLPAQLDAPNDEAILNTSEVMFKWEDNSIAEGISYLVQLSKTSDFSDIIYQSDSINQKELGIEVEADGTYFWRVESRSADGENKVSKVKRFEIDTFAPPAPNLSELPPEITGKTLTLFYQADLANENHHVSYDVAYASQPDFSDSTLHKTFGLEYTWHDLEYGEAYFRVRTIDKAGNTSDWSRIVATRLTEPSYPLLDLKIDHQYISPENSPMVQDIATIELELKESAEEDLKLILLDSSAQKIMEFDFADGVTVIPSSGQRLPEGQYRLFIEKSGKALSRLYTLIVDNSNPQAPIINAEDATTLTNLTEITLNIKSDPASITHLFLNDVLVSQLAGEDDMTVNKLTKEGENTFKAVSTDLAGNSSESSYTLTTDWTAPVPPQIKLKPDTVSKKLIAEVLASEDEKVEVYNLAGHHLDLGQGLREGVLIENWIQKIEYSFYAVAQDAAGNRSIASPIVSYTTPAESVLGVSTKREDPATLPIRAKSSKCEFTYNSTFKIVTKSDCTLTKPIIDSLAHIHPEGDIYWINVFGEHNRMIKIIVKYTKCKEKSIVNPKTWFGCEEVEERRTEKELQTYGQILSNINKRRYAEYQNRWDVNNRYQLLTASGNNLEGNEINNQAEVIFNYKVADGVWVDFKALTYGSNKLTLSKPEVVKKDGNGSKYFRFPFNKIIGVTQWHGVTAFSDHTGIDFAAVREPIYAMADGYIKKAEWDNYNGSCLSGGYYIQVAHDNGMHSVYLHLSEFVKDDGTQIRVGDRVRKGDRIGTSGNSGVYQCKPLGYHLHLEIRKDQYQSNNVDPVKWIDIDWNKIVTVGADIYPGRLTGNNPHPSF